MFDRAAITLGIGPHSSYLSIVVVVVVVLAPVLIKRYLLAAT